MALKVYTPYQAAQERVGVGQIARVIRYRLDGTRCGLAQGRHAAWNWAFYVQGPIPNARHDLGRGLVAARRYAATLAEYVVETWEGGKSFRRGKLGGLREERTP
jgi:hypothetical protein